MFSTGAVSTLDPWLVESAETEAQPQVEATDTQATLSSPGCPIPTPSQSLAGGTLPARACVEAGPFSHSAQACLVDTCLSGPVLGLLLCPSCCVLPTREVGGLRDPPFPLSAASWHNLPFPAPGFPGFRGSEGRGELEAGASLPWQWAASAFPPGQSGRGPTGCSRSLTNDACEALPSPAQPQRHQLTSRGPSCGGHSAGSVRGAPL